MTIEDFIARIDDATSCQCDDCEAVMTAGNLVDIVDMQERLTPGGVVPAGQCPACGALAYVIDNQLDQAANAAAALKAALPLLESLDAEYLDDRVDPAVPPVIERVRAALAAYGGDSRRSSSRGSMATGK